MANVGDGVGVGGISSLVRNRCASKIRLLPSRLWNSSSLGRAEIDHGFDFVGIDEEGNAIHVVIDKNQAPIYRRVLREGCVYIFTNIGCIPAGHYRPVMRAERLRFNSSTKVHADVDFRGVIKRHHFELVSYQTAASRLNNDINLTDLIGCITQIENPGLGNTRLGEGTRSKFCIQDMDGNEFPVTLWGALSLEFRQLRLLETRKTTIIIVCVASIRPYKGEIQASSISATKFYVNLQIPEVAEYFSRFQHLDVFPELVSSTSKVSTNVVSNATLENYSATSVVGTYVASNASSSSTSLETKKVLSWVQNQRLECCTSTIMNKFTYAGCDKMIEKNNIPFSVSDDYLMPVLRTLQSPLFDKLDSSKEFDIKNLVDHLIEENPPRKISEVVTEKSISSTGDEEAGPSGLKNQQEPSDGKRST